MSIKDFFDQKNVKKQDVKVKEKERKAELDTQIAANQLIAKPVLDEASSRFNSAQRTIRSHGYECTLIATSIPSLNSAEQIISEIFLGGLHKANQRATSRDIDPMTLRNGPFLRCAPDRMFQQIVFTINPAKDPRSYTHELDKPRSHTHEVGEVTEELVESYIKKYLEEVIG